MTHIVHAPLARHARRRWRDRQAVFLADNGEAPPLAARCVGLQGRLSGHLLQLMQAALVFASNVLAAPSPLLSLAVLVRPPCRGLPAPSPWGPLYGTERLDPSHLWATKASSCTAHAPTCLPDSC